MFETGICLYHCKCSSSAFMDAKDTCVVEIEKALPPAALVRSSWQISQTKADVATDAIHYISYSFDRRT